MLTLKEKFELRAQRSVEQLVEFKFDSGKQLLELHTDIGYCNKVHSVISVPLPGCPHDTMAEILSELTAVARANISGEEDNIHSLSENIGKVMNEVMGKDHAYYSIEHDSDDLLLSLKIVGNDICPLRVNLHESCVLDGIIVSLTPKFHELGYGLIDYNNVVKFINVDEFKAKNYFDIVNTSEDVIQYEDGLPVIDKNVTKFYAELEAAINTGAESELFTLRKVKTPKLL